MKSKIIKTLSLLAMTGVLFASSTAFAAVPAVGTKAPHVCVCNAAHQCGRYRMTSYGSWSSGYYVGNVVFAGTYFHKYERYRTVTVKCQTCYKVLDTYKQYQHKLCLPGAAGIPVEAWH